MGFKFRLRSAFSHVQNLKYRNQKAVVVPLGGGSDWCGFGFEVRKKATTHIFVGWTFRLYIFGKQ